MSKRAWICTAAVAALSLAPLASAQLAYTNTYPFATPRAVASDDGDQTIYGGAGSGTFVLDGTSGEPVLKAGVEAKLHSDGMVRDIALTPLHVYEAADRNGLVRFDRGTPLPNPGIAFKDAGPAWAIDVAVHDFADFDLVFLGTNDSEAGGMLHLIQLPVLSNDTTDADKDQFPFTSPIYALASVVDGNALTLLVGTACGTITTGGNPPQVAPVSIWRFDFDLSSGLPTTFPSPTATWAAEVETSPGSGLKVPMATFVRDIVIDPSTDSAYVAAFTRGVFKLDISGTGLSQQDGNGFPIVAPNGNVGHYDGLALYDGSLGKILTVALGPPFSEERLYFGDCNFPVPCDDLSGNDNTGYDGLRLYDVSSGAVEVGSILGHETKRDRNDPPQPLAEYMPGPPLKVSVRESGSGTLFIDAAGDQKGARRWPRPCRAAAALR